MAKRYFRKTIIYAEECASFSNGDIKRTTGNFEVTEDITNDKADLIKTYGYF